jgi:hypothetical protein
MAASGLRPLPTKWWVIGGRPHPPGQLEPSPSGASIVGLVGRATAVPEAAVTSGIQRTTMVTRKEPEGWAPVPDLGRRRRPKLHGMQGVKVNIGLWPGDPALAWFKPDAKRPVCQIMPAGRDHPP